MYKIKDTSTDYLLDNGFKTFDNEIFRLRFPISFYKNIPVVFCRATVIPESGKKVQIDVEKANGQPYTMWYDTECDHLSKRFRNELNNNIHKKMNKIGARRYADR